MEVDSENDPRPDYSMLTPNLQMHKTDLTQRRRWFCLHLDVEAVTTLADTTIINHVL